MFVHAILVVLLNKNQSVMFVIGWSFLRKYLGNCDVVQGNDIWLLQLLSLPAYAHSVWWKGHMVWAPDLDDFGVNRKYFSNPFLSLFQAQWFLDGIVHFSQRGGATRYTPNHVCGRAALGRARIAGTGRARMRACRITNQIVAISRETPKMQRIRSTYAYTCIPCTMRFNMRQRHHKTPEPFVFCVHLVSFGENYRLKTWTRFNKLFTVKQYLHDVQVKGN